MTRTERNIGQFNTRIGRAALTLIELMVVLGIIAVLIALILPAVQRVRDTANRIKCANNLKQIGLALHHYHDGYGAFPPGCSYQNGKDPYPFMSWMTRLLPFLEQDALWARAQQAYTQDRFFETPPHFPILGQPMPVFACPSDGRTLETWNTRTFPLAFTSYLGVEGTNHDTKNGVLFLDSHVRFGDITDGTSTTLAVGERPPSPYARFRLVVCRLGTVSRWLW